MMMLSRSSVAGFSGVFLLSVAGLHGEGLKLMLPEGKALPIVVAGGSAPHTRAAAEELATHIGIIGGVRPEVLEGTPDPLPAQAIWVGYQSVLSRLFPGKDFTLNHPEEVYLIGNQNHIAITGRDQWDPKHSTVQGRRYLIENKQGEHGNANAVFTFLQDVIGVRWLYPGELGTDYPAAESLNIQPFEIRHHPQFRSRSGLFNQLEIGYIKSGAEQDWARHQRVLLHSLDMLGGHYFKDWWDKYGETRPELFALQPDGTRGTYPEARHRVKLCEGEPAVWDLWMKEQEALLAQYPHCRVLAAMPNDGYFDGHCTDPRSRAWDPDPAETDVRIRVKWANGVSEEWPPLSDRYVTFANTLADMVKSRFPDQELYVSTNAYGDVGRPKPVRAVPRDNVLIISVNNFHGRDKAARDQHQADFLNWAGISKAIIWRPNLGNQGGRMWAMPDVPFQELMDDFRFVAEHGAVGVFFDTLFEHWATAAPYYYLIGQLAWNPRANGHAILNDYFSRCYGPAAEPMRNFWLLMEKTRNDLVYNVASVNSALNVPDYYTEVVFTQAEAFIERARALASSSEGKYARRVEFTRCGLEFTRAVVSIRGLMRQFEQARKDEREMLRDALLSKWEVLGEMSRVFPPHAINFKRLGGAGNSDNAVGGGENGGAFKRITGLHPSAPVKASTLRELKEGGLDQQ